MGDIADAMINGDLDCETGEYIGEGGGFPRTMNSSYSQRKRSKLPVEQGVVVNYLKAMNVPVRINARIFKKYRTDFYPQITSVTHLCNKMRATNQSWSDFKAWFKTNYPDYKVTPIINKPQREDSAGEQFIQDQLDSY